MTWLLIKFGVRFVVFGAVFAFAAWKHDKIEVKPKWALPLVGLVFAVMNTGLYWLSSLVLNVASLFTLSLFMPLIVNTALLWGTNRVLRPLKIDGLLPMLWLAVLLTVAHGVLWVALDVIP